MCDNENLLCNEQQLCSGKLGKYLIDLDNAPILFLICLGIDSLYSVLYSV